MVKSLALIGCLILQVGLIFAAGIQKNLPATVSAIEWQRLNYATSAALTAQKRGIGGFVLDDAILDTLMRGGITDDENLLIGLGLEWPNNLADGELIKRALERAVATAEQDHPIRLSTFGGEDVGLINSVRVGFALFGTRAESPYYAYFVFLGMGVALFVFRFHDRPVELGAATLMMMALAIIVCSDLICFRRSIGEFAGGPGTSIKDSRFFGTVAAIPLLHLVCLFARPQKLATIDYAVAALQAALVGFAFHVRGSLAWAAIAIAICWLILIWRRRSEAFDPGSSRSIYLPALYIAAFAATSLLVNVSLHPLYAEERTYAGHPVAPGLLYSLQFHPDFEARLSESFNGTSDDAMYVEAAKIAIAKLPPEERDQHLLRGYPTRQAIATFSLQRFLEIARDHPGFVAETFLIYKPRAIARSIWLFHTQALRGVQPWQLACIVIAFACVAGVLSREEAPAVLGRIAAIAGLFSLVSLIPNEFSPASQHVMIDHFTWSIFFLLTLAVVGVQLVSSGAPGRESPRMS